MNSTVTPYQQRKHKSLKASDVIMYLFKLQCPLEKPIKEISSFNNYHKKGRCYWMVVRAGAGAPSSSHHLMIA